MSVETMNETDSRDFMKKIGAAFLIAVISCFVFLTGCTGGKTAESSKQPSSAGAVESIASAAEATLSVSDKLPSQFPKEIPIPKEAQMLASIAQNDSVTVSFDLKKTFDETLKMYKDYFKSAGYQIASETLFEDSYMGMGKRGGNELMVMISMTTDDSKLSSVSLTYQSKKQ
jgi:hypothetical protein